MMAFILATDFDFIAYMSKMAFLFGSFFSRQWCFWNMINLYINATRVRLVSLTSVPLQAKDYLVSDWLSMVLCCNDN